MAAFTNRSDLQAYLRKMSDPRTPEEWTLAITNPYSPVYKDLMIVMQEYAIEERWLEEFVERMIRHEKREESVEQQALQDAAAYAERKEQRERELAAGKPQPSLAEKERAELVAEKDELTASIADMVESQQALNESISQTNKYLEKIARDWNEEQKQQAADFVSEWGVSPERQTMVEAAFQLLSPVKILEVNPMLLQRMALHENQEQSLAEDLMSRFGFVRELNVLAKTLADDVEEAFNPSHFLQALRDKKPKPVPGCTARDKEMICDAITGVCRRGVDKQALHEVSAELEAKRRQLVRVEGFLERSEPRI